MHRIVQFTATCCFLFLLPLEFANAGERQRVDVSFSVQAVQMQDTVSARLSVKAEWALTTVDMETGDRLVSAGSGTTPLIPGSLIKLFVTAAILAQNTHEAIDLGAVVSVNGDVKKNRLKGDVILKGAGNPFLSTKDLQEAVLKIKSLGIKEVSGDVIVDDSLFDVKEWKNRYAGPAYGKPSALGLDMHTVSITTEGNLRKVLIDPVNNAVKVSFNPSGRPGVRQIDDYTYEVTGDRPDAPAVHKRFSLMSPALYAGGTFLTLLKRNGIAVLGTVKQGRLPAHAKEIGRIGAADIKALAMDTNTFSLNTAADNMLLLLGARAYGAPGTKEKGIQAVNGFLSNMGVTLNNLVMDDGSGVSERNRVSADQMVAFLRAAATKPWSSTFSESLSRPGMNGRLQDINYKSDRTRAKSGEVYGAYGLAGYVQQQNGRKIAFAYMVNGANSDVEAAKAGTGDVLRKLEQLN